MHFYLYRSFNENELSFSLMLVSRANCTNIEIIINYLPIFNPIQCVTISHLNIWHLDPFRGVIVRLPELIMTIVLSQVGSVLQLLLLFLWKFSHKKGMFDRSWHSYLHSFEVESIFPSLLWLDNYYLHSFFNLVDMISKPMQETCRGTYGNSYKFFFFHIILIGCWVMS